MPNVLPADYVYRHGKAVTLRAGADVTLIACGHMVWTALQAAHLLAEQGVQAGVVNMSTIKPLDEQVVRQAAAETRLVVTIEEHSIIGGLGGAVAEVMSEDGWWGTAFAPGHARRVWRVGHGRRTAAETWADTRRRGSGHHGALAALAARCPAREHN